MKIRTFASDWTDPKLFFVWVPIVSKKQLLKKNREGWTGQRDLGKAENSLNATSHMVRARQSFIDFLEFQNENHSIFVIYA